MRKSEWDKRLAATIRQRRLTVPAPVREAVELTLASLPERGGVDAKTDATSRPRRLRSRWAFAAASIVALLAGAAVFLNGASSFAETIRTELRSIFFASGDPALVREGEAGAGTGAPGTLLERTSNGYTLRIHELMYDGQRLALSYSVTRPGGIDASLWVAPAFALDGALKARWPGIVGTNDGALQGDVKTGTVSYYFTGEAPEQFTLKVNVPAIAVFADPAKQTATAGDWSFELPVRRTGERGGELDKAALPHAEKQGVRFEAQRVREASRSTLWQFRWTYPAKLLPNALDAEAPGYGISYRIEAAGRTLTVTFDSASGGPIKKGDRDGDRYGTVTLATEPLPQGAKEVAITPILRTWERDGTGEAAASAYTEKPLDEFKLVVPLPHNR